MKDSEGARALASHLTASQARLLAAHWGRLPDAERAALLVHRWAETNGLPARDLPFLHLLYLGACSEALFLALMRHPTHFAGLTNQVNDAAGLGREGMEERLARLFLARGSDEPASALSAFRSLQTARILLQDVLGILPFEEVTRELSCLADTLIARSFVLTYQPVREAMGLPMRVTKEGRSLECSLAVFALGKLGGMELNYASDVDLVCFYQADGETDAGHPNQSFFNAWVQSAVALLTKPTPDGPCLKVDTALRPRGRDGELTLSFDAALSYYREWSDLWERQAWIKGRTCAGDAEAGALFLRSMRSIIYQPYSWSGIARQVRLSREKTLRELARLGRQEPRRNVKEGAGAIRDAEFACQVLQMTHGQKDRWVREGQTLLGLQKLNQKGILPARYTASLSGAYILLRRAEHWAQVQGMRQTHALPSNREEWAKLARALGLVSPQDAQRRIAQARDIITALYRRTIEDLEKREPGADELSLLLSGEGMREVLRLGGVYDPDRALPYLASMYGILTAHLDSPQRRLSFLRIHYSLQREFRQAPDPYRGLVCLSRLVGSLAAEEDALDAILNKPRLVRLLFRLVSRSGPLLEAVLRWPFLVERMSFEKLRSLEGDFEALDLAALDADGIREVHKTALFLIHAREIVMGDGVAWSQRLHTRLADGVCAAVFGSVCRRTESREDLAPGFLARRLALLALGRQGFGEMHPRSDLDLVCVKRAQWLLEEDPDRSARLEERFVRDLVDAFTAVTRHGGLYDVDFRLRPYGQSGPQVQSLQAFREYFHDPARLWERVAYLKARVVAGDAGLGGEVLRLIWALSLTRGAPASELGELLDLRRRLGDAARDLEGAVKFWPGGLWHADMLILVLQLRAGLPPEPGGGTGLIRRLAASGLISEEWRRRLYVARAFQDALLHRCRLHLDRPPSVNQLSRGLHTLHDLWAASAEGLSGDTPPDSLEDTWAAHCETIEAAWRELVEVV